MVQVRWISETADIRNKEKTLLSVLCFWLSKELKLDSFFVQFILVSQSLWLNPN